jgi:hypothetical protein
VKNPFSWQVTWLNGQSTINVASEQMNAAIARRGLRNLHRRAEPGDRVTET